MKPIDVIMELKGVSAKPTRYEVIPVHERDKTDDLDGSYWLIVRVDWAGAAIDVPIEILVYRALQDGTVLNDTPCTFIAELHPNDFDGVIERAREGKLF